MAMTGDTYLVYGYEQTMIIVMDDQVNCGGGDVQEDPGDGDGDWQSNCQLRRGGCPFVSGL